MHPRSWVLLLSLAIMVAGCAGRGADEPPTPTPSTLPTPAEPTPEPTPPAEPTPASPTTPTAPPTPAPIPPRVVANQTFDYNTEGDPTGQSPKTKPTEPVPEGHATIVINASIVRASPAPTGLPVSGSINTPSLHVLDPSGKEVLTLKDGDAPASLSVPASKGAWSIRYQGSGTARAHVVLTALG